MRDVCLRIATIVLGLVWATSAHAQQRPIADAAPKAGFVPNTGAAPDAGTAPNTGVPSAGGVPNVIRFSGSFRPSNGAPAQSIESVTLALYRDQVGGNPLWQETQNVAVDGEGKYSLLMGATQNAGVPLELLSAGESRWFGVQFNRPGEIEQPRVLMASVPYALKSVDAETLGGRPASAYLLAPVGTANTWSNTSSDSAGNGMSSSNDLAAHGATPPSTTVGGTISAAKPRTISGTQNYIPYFTDGSNDLGNSVMQQANGNIGIGTTPGANAGTAPSLDLRTSPFSQIGMGQTVDYLTFFSSDQYGPAIYWNPGKDMRFGKGGTGLYNAFGFTEQMRIQSSTGNVGIGTASPGSKLDVNGNIDFSGGILYQANLLLQVPGGVVNGNVALGIGGLPSNTAGVYNTAIGDYALQSNASGNYNTATGAYALNGNTGGINNTAVGVQTLGTNATGSYNTAIGVHAMEYTTGGSNTASGYNALQGSLFGGSTGEENTANGYQALQNNTASYNTAIGSGALSSNTTGDENTAIGVGALQANTTGGQNIAIGNGAGVNVSGGNNNNIHIGSSGSANDNFTIRIGDVQGSFFAVGIYSMSPSGSVPVVINSSGQLGAPTSSRRYKEDVRDMGDASRGLMNLRPVTFRYKKAAEDGSKPLQYGLIAEEVAEVYPDLVVYTKDGKPDAVQYQNVNAMLLNEVQRQQAEIRRLEQTIKEQNEGFQRRLAKLEATLSLTSGVEKASSVH